MIKTIGHFLESVSGNQVVCYYDRNNNIQWVGKAGSYPIFLDWCVLKSYEYVGHELRVYQE